MKVKLLVEGGNMTPGPAIAQKLGPMGINMGKVISDVNEKTQSFKGTKVPVELDIDASTKEYTIKVSSPPVPELIKKELGLDKGSGDHKKTKVGNIAIEQIISIAKTKLPEMLENDLKAAVKTIVGSCVSLGILVENKLAAEIEEDLVEGIYDKEINEEKTEVDSEKRKKLDDYFNNLSEKQSAAAKIEEEAKEAKEKSKAAPEESEKPEEPKK
jgi:large subunit ribosomal protein L11